jgi:signal transduction histidine kinase
MMPNPHHLKIQRRLGWVILVAGIALAAANIVDAIGNRELFERPDDRIFNALWVIAPAAALFLLSRIKHTSARYAQVMFFGLIGFFAMSINEPSNMTGMAFIIYAIFLAIQYGFLERHFVRKLTAIVLFTILMNATFMLFKGQVDLVGILASAVFIVFYLLLLWIAFAETLQTYIDRTKELELERRKDSVFVRFGKNTAGLVHNLRNMLSVAYGFNDLVRNEEASDHIKDLVSRERAAYDRMSGTITRTLAVVKAKQDTSTKPIDLNELAAGLVDFLNTDLQLKHNVKLKLNLSTKELVVSVQPLELCEVIENIIRNSWEAMANYENHQLKVIEISTFEDTAPGLIIRDNGPGIPGFESCENDECRRFFTIGKTTKEGGTGLGIPFVLEAAKSNGWEIAISSLEAGGVETRMVFTGIPATEAEK